MGASSEARRARTERRPPTRLLLAVAALSLWTLPVDYRAGAATPHPHAFLQLWIDAAHGSLEHHHAAFPAPAEAAGEAERSSASPTISPPGLTGGARVYDGAGGAVSGRDLLLATLTLTPALGTLRGRRAMPDPLPGAGRNPQPEPPPPQLRAA
jgi:hypothetical protein